MSRFQFLVFTFVIAMGLLVGVLKTGTFPERGADILGLIGISAGSYVGAKITQKAEAEARQNGQFVGFILIMRASGRSKPDAYQPNSLIYLHRTLLRGSS